MGSALLILTAVLPLIADAPEVVTSVTSAVNMLKSHDGTTPLTADQQKVIDDALAAIDARVQAIAC